MRRRRRYFTSRLVRLECKTANAFLSAVLRGADQLMLIIRILVETVHWISFCSLRGLLSLRLHPFVT